MVASLSHCWSRGELVLWPLSRILLLPLLIMCAAPKHKPVFRGKQAHVLYSAAANLLSTASVIGIVLVSNPIYFELKVRIHRDRGLWSLLICVGALCDVPSGSKLRRGAH
jgi:hydrogenase-4 membrane subunit HyfE